MKKRSQIVAQLLPEINSCTENIRSLKQRLAVLQVEKDNISFFAVKRKKEYESFLEYESERLDIPEEVLAGQPTLRMIGNHSMNISGNYIIEEYSTESICLKTLKKKIHLSGEHLAIRYFRKDEIKIVGNIQTVSFFK